METLFGEQSTWDGRDKENDGSFEILLAKAGLRCVVGAEETVIEALSRIGVYITTACGQGVCGICRTAVLHGEPDHRDYYLTLEEQAANDSLMPCCSRSRTAQLVLDL